MHSSISKDSLVNQAISIILLLIAFSIPLSTSLTNVLLMFFTLLWIIEGNFFIKSKYIWQYKATSAALILLISLLIGSIYSLATLPEIILYLKKMSKLFYLPLLIYYFNDPKQRAWSINAFIVAGVLTTFIGLIYNNPTPFKNSIDTSLITMLTTFWLMHKIDLNLKLSNNIIILLLVLINAFYLFHVSAGRTSQLIFLLLIPIFLIQKFSKVINKKTLLLATTFILSLLLCCVVYSKSLQEKWLVILKQYNNYVSNPINHEQNSTSLRLTYYTNTLKIIKEKPWLGWGTGSFTKAYKQFIIKYNPLPSAVNHNSEYIFTTNPHNEYLLFGAQLGILGIALLLWFFYTLFKASLIIPSPEKEFLQGITFIIGTGCLSNSWLMDFTSGYLFVIFSAIALGALPDVQLKSNF